MALCRKIRFRAIGSVGRQEDVDVHPPVYPLSMHGRRVGLEVKEFLLPLGIQPPLNTSIFWLLLKATVLVGIPFFPARMSGISSLLQ